MAADDVTTLLPYRAGVGEAPILVHEEAHVRHRHSYDIVVVERLTALQWFNPVVWFLRQELSTHAHHRYHYQQNGRME